MPNRCIEIHDSVLERVSLSQGVAELHFSSIYIHQSEGEPGVAPGIGWFQEAVLRIFDAVVPATLPQVPIELGDGELVLGNTLSKNEIPLPLDHRGPFELRLIPMWEPESILLFRGSGAILALTGNSSAIEKFSPQ